MNICITGATGLVGIHLSNYYLEQGYNVYVLLREESGNSLLDPRINRIYGNLNNKQDVDFFIQRSLPHYFIHLAAQTQAYDALKYPYNTFYTNFVGTLNVLESLREYGRAQSIVIASSDKAYGELEGDEYLESHSLNAVYPYDASKAGTEILAKSYKETYDMPVVITRACNIYGEGDTNQERLIPGILHSVKNNNVFVIRNNGEDIREYIHVQDVVSAYVKIADFVSIDRTVPSFNISSGERYSTLEVFNLMQSKLPLIPHRIDRPKGKEIKKQFMNSDLLRSKTNWKATHTLEGSLDSVIDAYMR